MKIRAVLMAGKGFSNVEISADLGIQVGTLRSWLYKDKAFKSRFDRAKESWGKEFIEERLVTSANGGELVTTEDTFILEDENGNKRKRKVTKKRIPPDPRAIELLARKYAPDDYAKKEKVETELKVRITQQDRSLTFEERLAILERDKDEGSTVEVVDFKEVTQGDEVGNG